MKNYKNGLAGSLLKFLKCFNNHENILKLTPSKWKSNEKNNLLYIQKSLVSLVRLHKLMIHNVGDGSGNSALAYIADGCNNLMIYNMEELSNTY